MTEPVGEDAWLALVDEASRTARDISHRIGVVELYVRAIAAEPWSTKLWLARCEWFWSLHTDCQNGDAGWPEEEQLMGQECFSKQLGLNLWQDGVQATQYRLNDSHEIWNRWMSIELLSLAEHPSRENVERIKSIFLQRLQVPHTAWDDTSTSFSNFLTKYDERAYEETMVLATTLARPAKELYRQRESHELQLAKAKELGDVEAVRSTMRNYLEWEAEQILKIPKKGIPASPSILCVALYERALSSTPLGIDATIWEDYIVYLTTLRNDNSQWPLPDVLSVIQRATTHCPWSGALWARYILRAESEKSDFETMERIKHAATDNRALDRDGMGGVVEFYSAWCGFLKRRTMVEEANDDDPDIAEMGLRSALESVQEWGQRRHGKKEWKGDPLFRIERVFIQHLTQQIRYEEARQNWRKLVGTHGHNYEFWQQYYLWEMTVRSPAAPPNNATDVLIQALGQRNLDWPEKMMEIYVRHCNNYEDVNALLHAMSTVHRLSKKVAQRRAAEQAEAAALYAAQQPQVVTDIVENDPPSSGSKRKREFEEEVNGSEYKKVKSAAEHDAMREQQLKRDRENTTILVTNLPPDVTQTKVRQYFKDYGHLNSMTLKTESDKSSTTALLEFRSPEDVKSSLLRDGKYFGDRQIHVEPGTGLTLYVTNYPPTADDAYLKNLFKDCGEVFSIRWPSLKHNTHRRFCYISFKTVAAAAAATELDGKSLGGVHKLVAKYSDPANKKDREGAMAEGREIHITGIDSTISEDDLKDVFSKYGKVEKTRILKTLAGESKGAAFVSFEKKEEANASLELDKTKLKSKILTVELSTGKNFKHTATVYGKGSSASPGPDADGDYAMSPSSADGHNPSRQELTNRTITLMNIPDTVNVERIRAIAEPFGEIIKLVLRPDHQGAIIEYSDPTAAGKAALGLTNHEIAPGRRLRTGGMKDLLSQKDEIRSDRMQFGQAKKSAPSLMAPPAPVRRPVGPGGRGGLGQKKRGLGFSSANTTAPAAGTTSKVVNGNGEEAKPAQKSQADFKALVEKGRAQ